MNHENENNHYESPRDGTSGNFPLQIPDLKLLLTEQEAAAALGISRRTLWTLRNTRQIPSIRIGKCVRYSVEALKNWIEQQDTNNQPPKKLPR